MEAAAPCSPDSFHSQGIFTFPLSLVPVTSSKEGGEAERGSGLLISVESSEKAGLWV